MSIKVFERVVLPNVLVGSTKRDCDYSWLRCLLPSDKAAQPQGGGGTFFPPQNLIQEGSRKINDLDGGASKLREQCTVHWEATPREKNPDQLRNVLHSQGKQPSQLLPSQVSKFTWISNCCVPPSSPFQVGDLVQLYYSHSTICWMFEGQLTCLFSLLVSKVKGATSVF